MAGSERRNCVVVVFIGSQPAWTEQLIETRPGVPQNGGNGLVFDWPRSKRDPVHREGCGVPQNGTPRDTVHLHRRPPPASMGSCSSSLHRVLLHQLLFNHPSTGTPSPSTVHPALHTMGSCSSTPPRAPLHRLLFIQRQQPLLYHGVLFIQPPTGNCSSTLPPTTLTVNQGKEATGLIGFN